MKDMTEDEISHVSDKLMHDTADAVKKDIATGFTKYGHHMWNLS